MRSTSVHITRRVQLPSPRCLERCRRTPELGPRLLLFSGGTALRELAQRLIAYTHNSIHLITPFDSGGSSAEIRRAFRMLSVGDLRNRLLALADQSIHGQPEIFSLFAYRFPRSERQPRLRRRLARMIRGEDPMVAAVPDPMRKIVRQHLRFFHEKMPSSFDLRGANIGNLILAGGYLNQSRDIDAVSYLFSKLVEVRGVVRPIADEDLQLAAELDDGTVVCGQHRLTGKEEAPLASPIRRLFLSRRLRHPEPHRLELRDNVRQLIARADLICFPMGSFYTSLVANLLPAGVGAAVAAADVPKVYVPNTGHDPEQLGLALPDQVRRLLAHLRQSAAAEVPVQRLLHYVLVDVEGAGWSQDALREVERQGVQVLDVALAPVDGGPRVDGERLAQVLVSMA